MQYIPNHATLYNQCMIQRFVASDGNDEVQSGRQGCGWSLALDKWEKCVQEEGNGRYEEVTVFAHVTRFCSEKTNSICVSREPGPMPLFGSHVYGPTSSKCGSKHRPRRATGLARGSVIQPNTF